MTKNMVCPKDGTKLVRVSGYGVKTELYCPACMPVELYIVRIPKEIKITGLIPASDGQ